jgi:hypothetical protein
VSETNGTMRCARHGNPTCASCWEAMFDANKAATLALAEADRLCLAIAATLDSVAVPSGVPAVSRAFTDIRGMLLVSAAGRRARGEP